MIVVFQRQRCELLFSFRESYNKPPVRCKAQRLGFTSAGYRPICPGFPGRSMPSASRTADCVEVPGATRRSMVCNPGNSRMVTVATVPMFIPSNGLSLAIMVLVSRVSRDILLVNEYSIADGGKQYFFSNGHRGPFRPSCSDHRLPVPARTRFEALTKNKSSSQSQYDGFCHARQAVR